MTESVVQLETMTPEPVQAAEACCDELSVIEAAESHPDVWTATTELIQAHKEAAAAEKDAIEVVQIARRAKDRLAAAEAALLDACRRKGLAHGTLIHRVAEPWAWLLVDDTHVMRCPVTNGL